jgi:hypothetical protein
MELQLIAEIAALRRYTVAELRRRYAELFGESTRATNKVWLVRRIAWRLQAMAEGDLSERARRRAAELARDADLRLLPPRPAREEATSPELLPSTRAADSRIPCPGTVLLRTYKGTTLQVRVLARGFEFDGQVFHSLSAVAKAVTGSHCNGLLFFRLIHRRKKS